MVIEEKVSAPSIDSDDTDSCDVLDEALLEVTTYAEVVTNIQEGEVLFEKEIKQVETAENLCEDAGEKSEAEREKLKDKLRDLLYHLLCKFHVDDDNDEVMKCIRCAGTRKKRCIDMFEFIPTHGFLNAKECQMISVFANPKPNTTFHAQAMCLVEGGEPELLTITGVSSDVACYLVTDCVEFGPQVRFL